MTQPVVSPTHPPDSSAASSNLPSTDTPSLSIVDNSRPINSSTSITDTSSTGYSQLIQMDYDERAGAATRENGGDSLPLTSTNTFSASVHSPPGSRSSSDYNSSPTNNVGGASTFDHGSTQLHVQLNKFKNGTFNGYSPRTSNDSGSGADTAKKLASAHARSSEDSNGSHSMPIPKLIEPDADDPSHHASISPGQVSPKAREANFPNIDEAGGDNGNQFYTHDNASTISSASSDGVRYSEHYQDTRPLLRSPESAARDEDEHTDTDRLDARHSRRGPLQSVVEQGRLERSLSVVSIRALNDTVDWIVDKYRRYKPGRRSHFGPPRPNEIYYSVFKPPNTIPGTFSLSIEQLQTGKDGYAMPVQATQGEFDVIVDDAIEVSETLHIHPKLISQGSSGSYFVYNATGKIVGVFKPKDEEPYGPLSPKWTKWLHRNLFPCFFGRSCLIPNNGYIAECAASLLDRQLGTHIVPFTDIVNMSAPSFYYRFFDRRSYNLKGKPLPQKVGSFQLFLHDYMQADQFLREHPLDNTRSLSRSRTNSFGSNGNGNGSGEPQFQWTPQVIAQFREEIEKLVILDYIMRNTDRGLDNWMVKLEWYETEVDDADDGEAEASSDSGSDDTTTAAGSNDQANSNRKKKKHIPYIRLGAIDSGLAFPWKHPDEWRSYPFGWLFLPMILIGQPFSRRTRDHFLPLLTSSEWWEESALVFRHLFSQDTEFSERMFKRQWAVLKGQAFNVVETLKDPEQGPLELVRRARVMVWDDEMDVPVNVPYDTITTAIDTPLWANGNVNFSNFAQPRTASAAYPPMEPPRTDILKHKPGTASSKTAEPTNGSSTAESVETQGDDHLDVQDIARRAAQATEEALSHSRNVQSSGDSGKGKKGRRVRGSSLILEAKYRALESSTQNNHSHLHPGSSGSGSSSKLARTRSRSHVVQGSRDAPGSSGRSQKPHFEDLIQASGPGSGSASPAGASGGSAGGKSNHDSRGADDSGDADRPKRRPFKGGRSMSAAPASMLSHLEPYRDDPSEEQNGTLHDMGFSVAEDFSQASRKVVVERLQTVTSRPPVFTWC